MQLVAKIHRWAGGLIGLLLALLGLTGALLVWKGAWIAWTVPGIDKTITTSPLELAGVTESLIGNSSQAPNYIIFANHDVAVHTINTGSKSGYYAKSDGTVLASWDSIWGRLETFLFDIHHYFLIGDPGKTMTGIAGLLGVGFVVTGLILWWSMRKTFKFRLWPTRMTRPSIIRQHRDLGVVLAPLLFLTMLTGVMMTLQPVAALILLPFSSPAEMRAANARPEVKAGSAENADWRKIMTVAQQRFPDAHIRLASLPRKTGDPITIRMKQFDEWHSNGRTMVWFDGETGEVLGTVDALKLPQGSMIYNLVYPLHAAKIGGLVYKIAQTLTGLALTLLGSLAVWSFWFRRPKTRKPD